MPFSDFKFGFFIFRFTEQALKAEIGKTENFLFESPQIQLKLVLNVSPEIRALQKKKKKKYKVAKSNTAVVQLGVPRHNYRLPKTNNNSGSIS